MVTQTERAETTGTPLKRICAWCHVEGIETVLQEGSLADLNGVPRPSGGICDAHRDRILAAWMAQQPVIVCPFCGTASPRSRFGHYARPEGCAELLRCPESTCRKFFAPLGRGEGEIECTC